MKVIKYFPYGFFQILLVLVIIHPSSIFCPVSSLCFYSYFCSDYSIHFGHRMQVNETHSDWKTSTLLVRFHSTVGAMQAASMWESSLAVLLSWESCELQ